jgi:hypothetical protein
MIDPYSWFSITMTAIRGRLRGEGEGFPWVDGRGEGLTTGGGEGEERMREGGAVGKAHAGAGEQPGLFDDWCEIVWPQLVVSVMARTRAA